MGPKKSNRSNSSEVDEHDDEEQYVTKEFFNQQMKLMMENLSASIQTSISDAMERHVVESSKVDDNDLLSAAAGAASGDSNTFTIEKSNIEHYFATK